MIPITAIINLVRQKGAEGCTLGQVALLLGRDPDKALAVLDNLCAARVLRRSHYYHDSCYLRTMYRVSEANV
ncbi:MAG: hypothetical protein AB9900_10840 [Humidesulfovibrio sp.]